MCVIFFLPREPCLCFVYTMWWYNWFNMRACSRCKTLRVGLLVCQPWIYLYAATPLLCSFKAGEKGSWYLFLVLLYFSCAVTLNSSNMKATVAGLFLLLLLWRCEGQGGAFVNYCLQYYDAKCLLLQSPTHLLFSQFLPIVLLLRKRSLQVSN